MNIAAQAIEEGTRFELWDGANVRRFTVTSSRPFMGYQVIEYVSDAGKRGEVSLRHDSRYNVTR